MIVPNIDADSAVVAGSLFVAQDPRVSGLANRVVISRESGNLL